MRNESSWQKFADQVEAPERTPLPARTNPRGMTDICRIQLFIGLYKFGLRLSLACILSLGLNSLSLGNLFFELLRHAFNKLVLREYS